MRGPGLWCWRAQGRAREVAVRGAVGAGGGRLVQQFLVESLTLGLTGAAIGLVFAWWSTRALAAFGTASIPRLEDLAIDWHVLLFTLATAAVTSVLFGLAPAFATTGINPAPGAGAGRGSLGRGSSRLRRGLVISELALAVVLLAGAGLLLRSYERISGVDPGFRAEHVLTFRLALPETKYGDGGSVSRFIADYVRRLAGTTGVDSASAVFGLPLDSEFDAYSTFTRRGEADADNEPTAGMRVITPQYLETLKIPLRRGRTFNDGDTATSPEVVLINEEAARRYWPNQDPIGQQIHIGARLTEARSGQKTIVGIIGDVKYRGLDTTAPPEMYLPHTQHPVNEITIAVRTAGDPMAFVPTARAELAALDRELPVSAVSPLTDVVRRSIAERRFVMLLLASFSRCRHPRSHRRLRRAGISRYAAHAGNRPPRGHRRVAGRRGPAVRARRRGARRHRARHRTAAGVRGRARALGDAVRRRRRRSADVRGRRRDAGSGVARRELCARKARGTGRSDGSAAE